MFLDTGRIQIESFGVSLYLEVGVWSSANSCRSKDPYRSVLTKLPNTGDLAALQVHMGMEMASWVGTPDATISLILIVMGPYFDRS